MQSAHSTSVIGVYVPCISSRTPNNLLGLWIFLNVYGIFLVLFATLCKAYTNIWTEELIIGYINRLFYFFFQLWRCNRLWDHVLLPNSFSFYFLSVLCCIHANLLKCKTCCAVKPTCGLILLFLLFFLNVFVVVQFVLYLCWNWFCGLKNKKNLRFYDFCTE